MIVRELFARLGFDLDEKSESKAEAAIEKIKKGLEALGIEEAVRRSYEFVSEKFAMIAESAGQLERLSTKTGLGVVAIQQLEYAADLTNVSVEELQHGLVHLARAAQEAHTQGGAAGGAFKRLGIETQDLVGPDGRLRSMDQLLGMVADKFKASTNPVEKMALAQELFSRGGANLLPLLNKGSAGIATLGAEAMKTGAVMNEGMVKRGVELEENLKRLKYAILGLTYAIFGPFVKAYAEGQESLTHWIEAHRKMIALRVEQVVRGIGQALHFASEMAQRFAGPLLAIAGAAFAATFPILSLIAVLGLLAEDIYSYTQGRDSITGRLLEAFQLMRDRFKGGFLSGLASTFDTALESAKSFFGFITDQMNKYGPLFGAVGGFLLGGPAGAAVGAAIGSAGPLAPHNVPMSMVTGGGFNGFSGFSPSIVIQATSDKAEDIASAVKLAIWDFWTMQMRQAATP